MAFLRTCSLHSRRSMTLHWGPQTWTQYSSWDIMRAESRRRIPSVTLLATPILVQPRHSWLSGLQVHIAKSCWVPWQPTPQILFLRAVSQSILYPPCTWAWDCLTHMQDLALGLIDLHLSVLSRFFWMASLLSNVSAARFSNDLLLFKGYLDLKSSWAGITYLCQTHGFLSWGKWHFRLS